MSVSGSGKGGALGSLTRRAPTGGMGGGQTQPFVVQGTPYGSGGLFGGGQQGIPPQGNPNAPLTTQAAPWTGTTISAGSQNGFQRFPQFQSDVLYAQRTPTAGYLGQPGSAANPWANVRGLFG